jgi:hypothetical protein
MRYRVGLAVGGFLLVEPIKSRGHFFNLSSMEIEPMAHD